MRLDQFIVSQFTWFDKTPRRKRKRECDGSTSETPRVLTIGGKPSFPRSRMGTLPVPLRSVRNVKPSGDSGPVPDTLDILPRDTLAFVNFELRALAIRA
jgi:hypothetical protein